MKEAEILKLEALSYWRFERNHIIGAIECQDADVKTMTRAKMLTETEVKVSITDIQREVSTKHYKHRQMRLDNLPSGQYYSAIGHCSVHYFYFLVPLRLKDKALEICKERYPYAGLLVLDGEVKDLYYDRCIKSIKLAKRLKRDRATETEIIHLGRGAVNTALRYGNKILALNSKNKEE